jgi:hypothetical protein
MAKVFYFQDFKGTQIVIQKEQEKDLFKTNLNKMEFDVMDNFLNKVQDERMRGLKIHRKI